MTLGSAPQKPEKSPAKRQLQSKLKQGRKSPAITLGDGTPVIILSWTAGGSKYPIVGVFFSRRIGALIVSNWDEQGRAEYGPHLAALCLSGIEGRPSEVLPEEAPVQVRTKGGHQATLLSRTAGGSKYPYIGVITFESGFTELAMWDAKGVYVDCPDDDELSIPFIAASYPRQGPQTARRQQQPAAGTSSR